MEANGFRQRIEQACFNQDFIKIIFQYPSSSRAVVKRGRVTDVFENAFDFKEIKDGPVTYSYKYIVEIMEAELEKPLEEK